MAGPSDEKKSLAPPVLRSGLTPTAKPSLTGPSKSFFLRPAFLALVLLFPKNYILQFNVGLAFAAVFGGSEGEVLDGGRGLEVLLDGVL